MKRKIKLLLGGIVIAIALLATSLPEKKNNGVNSHLNTEKSTEYTFHLSVFQLF